MHRPDKPCPGQSTAMTRRSLRWLSSGAAQLAVLCLYLALPAAFGARAEIWPLLGKLSALLVGILLYQIFNGQRSPLVAVLESPPFRYVGRISYGAYLVHHFVHFDWIEDMLRNFSIGVSFPEFRHRGGKHHGRPDGTISLTSGNDPCNGTGECADEERARG